MKQKSFSRFLCFVVLAFGLLLVQALMVYAAPPVAVNDSYTTPENTALNVTLPVDGLLANDTDPDVGDVLEVDNWSLPANGTLTGDTVNIDGTFIYTPDAGFAGNDTFTYIARDNNGEISNLATVFITVLATGVNNAPVITAPTNANTPPSVALVFNSISVNDIDAGGGTDSLNVTVTLTGASGTGTLLLGCACVTGTDLDGSDGTLDFDGNLFNINDALGDMSFTPDAALGSGDTVTMTIVVDDNGHNGTGGALTDTHIVTITIAGVVIVESGGSTTVTEGGATDTYTVALTSTPGTPVDITITTDGQCTVTGSPPLVLTFNSTTSQTVTVTAFQDTVLEGPHTCLITHVASGDPSFAGVPIADVNANVVDDEGGLVVVESDGSTNVTEGSLTDTYTFRLASDPGAAGTVTVMITTNGQCTALPSPLLFTAGGAGTWDDPQTVTVTAVDDGAVESSPHTCVITNTSTTAAASPYNLLVATVNANVTDNDAVAIVLVQSGGSTNVLEGGFTDSYTVRLGSQPTGDVTVNIAPDAQCTVSLPSLTFTTGNWFTPQPVTVTAFNDTTPEADPHTCDIDHTGASAVDTNYNNFVGPTLVVNVFDNDGGLPAGVTIGGEPVDIAEGGAPDTYTIALNTQPTANVLIIITPDADCTVSGNLTFLPGSGTTPQTVTVTAFDDTINEGAHTCTITHTASSADGAYNGIAIANVVANVTDNDAPVTPGVTVNPTAITVSEGDSGNFTVQLNTVPTVGSVTITSTSNSAECTITSTNPVILTNTTPATVTVQSVEDTTPEATETCTITNTLSGVTAPEYSAVTAASVTVTVNDDDTGNIAPVANNDAYNVTQDTPLTVGAPGVLLNDTDTDGPSALTVTGNTAPSTGSVTLNANGSFTYTPQAGFTGTATFDYTISDGADTDTATVTLTISATPVNNSPTAVNDSYTTPQDTPLTQPAPGVLANDFDPDGDLLVVNTGGTSTPSTGTVILNADGSFTYTPQTGFSGTATFTYLASDGTDDSLAATVTITITPAGNVTPVAVADAYTATELVPLVIAAPGVLANDTDADLDTLTAVLNANVTNGTLTLNANGSFTYTSNAGATTDSFTYHANDGAADSNIVTVTITITPTGGNTAPVVTVAGVTTSVSGTMVVIHVPFTDNVGDTHTATIDWGDGSGPQPAVVAALAVDGAFTYPTTGTFTITIVITDQLGASGSHTIILDVGTGVVRFPPPVALCMDQNFIADSMIRANVPDAIRHTVRCRPIVANGTYTNSPEEQAMSSANIGNLSVLQMGVLQAVDVFSPEGLVNLSGVTVCLRGSGTLLHLYGAPRTPHGVPTYPVAAFPGFTCGSLPQTGTLVLVNGSGGGTSGSGGGGATQPTPVPTISDPGLRLDSFPECTAVAFGGVNVRSTPSERGALLGVLSPDTPMSLITRVGMFYVIDYQGRTGYVRMDLVAFSCSG